MLISINFDKIGEYSYILIHTEICKSFCTD